MTDIDEAPPEASSSGRRIWKRAIPGQGSSRLSLLAMAVLYDAGEPLTREQLAERFIERLDVYQRAFLEAWYQRRRGIQRTANLKRRADNSDGDTTELPPQPFGEVVRTWLALVFLKRIYDGPTLERLPDGRYQPGRTAPRVLTLDGRRIAYTPEARKELEQSEADAGRLHLAGVEWDRLVKEFDIHTRAARLQFLTLVLRYVVDVHGQKPLDERKLAPQLGQLLRLLDTPTRQRETLRRAFDALFEV